MRPSPSLHYVSTLLDQRRRRHHRARRLWGAGLGLLGCGLLLVGWWVTLRFPPQSTPPAGVVLARGVHARRRLRSRVLPAAPAGGGGALRPQASRTARERGPPPAAPRLSHLWGHTLSHGPRRATPGTRARPADQETAASGPAAGEARTPPEARV